MGDLERGLGARQQGVVSLEFRANDLMSMSLTFFLYDMGIVPTIILVPFLHRAWQEMQVHINNEFFQPFS